MNLTRAQLNILRTAATAVITALAVLGTYYYPHVIWFTVAIAFAGSYGIHAIPAVSQTLPNILSDVNTRSNVMVSSPRVTSQGGNDMTVNEQPADDQAPELTDPIGQQGASLMGIAAPVTAETPVVSPETPAETTSAVSRTEFDDLASRVASLESR